jgi:transcriptional regulator with XRE-family HTH domain
MAGNFPDRKTPVKLKLSSLGIRLSILENYDPAMDSIGPKKPFRTYIREWMHERKIDQRRLAERLDCKEGTISKLLNGKMQLTVNWLSAFAFALNVEVADLYRDPKRPSADELLARMPEEKRKQAIEYLNYLATGTDK